MSSNIAVSNETFLTVDVAVMVSTGVLLLCLFFYAIYKLCLNRAKDDRKVTKRHLLDASEEYDAVEQGVVNAAGPLDEDDCGCTRCRMLNDKSEMDDELEERDADDAEDEEEEEEEEEDDDDDEICECECENGSNPDTSHSCNCETMLFIKTSSANTREQQEEEEDIPLLLHKNKSLTCCTTQQRHPNCRQVIDNTDSEDEINTNMLIEEGLQTNIADVTPVITQVTCHCPTTSTSKMMISQV